MTIAVVIPVFNLADEIGKCLDSVFAQTTKPDEVIVIDDGSTDATAEIVSRYPVQLIRQRNEGPGAARNKGLSQSKCEWVAFLDGDDSWLPTKVEKLRRTITLNPNAVLVANDDFMGPVGGPYVMRPLHEWLKKDKPTFSQLYRGCFLATSSVCVKRAVALEVKGMDPSLRSAQDYDLWLRMCLAGEIVFIPEALSRYHIREGSISFNIPRRYECSMIIADRYAVHVSKGLHLYRIALVHYEAVRMALAQGQYTKVFTPLLRLPFEIVLRLISGGSRSLPSTGV